MSQQALQTVFIDESQAMLCIRQSIAPYCKQQWALGVERLAVRIEPEEDTRSLQQLRFYWGVVLKEISEQARIEGQRYTADAWHELMKRTQLPRKIKKTRVAGRKKLVVTVSLGSTKGLSVKKMSEYLERVQAFAVNDLGVIFSLAQWETYQ